MKNSGALKAMVPIWNIFRSFESNGSRQRITIELLRCVPSFENTFSLDSSWNPDLHMNVLPVARMISAAYHDADHDTDDLRILKNMVCAFQKSLSNNSNTRFIISRHLKNDLV
jgi:hypothetical protein